MPAVNSPMTVAQLQEILSGMDGATELPIRIADYEGGHSMQVFSIRKHVVTDEDEQVTDAYVVING